MKKTNVGLLLFLTIIQSVFPWNPFISPQKVQAWITELKDIPDQKKSYILNKISNEYVTHDFEAEKAILFGQKALELAKKFQQTDQEIIALANIGNALRRLDKSKEAEKIFLSSLSLSEKNKSEKEILYVLRRMSIFYYKTNKPDTAFKYSTRAIKISRTISDDREFAELLPWAAYIQYQNKHKVKAINLLAEAIGINKEFGELSKEVLLLIAFARIQRMEKKFDKAIEILFKAQKISEANQLFHELSKIFNELGAIYHFLGDLEKSKNYYIRALSYYQRVEPDIYVIELYKRIGMVIMDLKDYNSALKYLLKAEILVGRMSYQNNQFMEMVVAGIGEIYFNLNRLDRAKTYYEKTLKLSLISRNNRNIASMYFSLGDIHRIKQNFSLAEKQLLKGLEISSKTKNSFLLQAGYSSMSQLYESWGRFKAALHYQKCFFDQFEKHYTFVQQERIAELEIKLKTEQKENQIKLQELSLSRAKILRDALIIGIGLVFIILVLLFRRYQNLFAFWKTQRQVGDFKLIEKLGYGSYGSVWKSTNKNDKSQVAAVKILNEDMLDESTIRRFRHEGTVTQGLNHANIVKILQKGEYTIKEAGELKDKLYIAMEYLEGQTLDQKMKDQGKLSVTESCYISSQISDALSYIHSKGIIHRDLKPGNIMVINQGGYENFIKLLDFGLAKSTLLSKMTHTGMVIGTTRYISPEQALGIKITTASDIFSFGLIFYEMLVGQHPFLADLYPNETIMVKAIIEDPPNEPIEVDPSLSKELNSLILHMLEKELKKRPTALQVQEALKQYKNSITVEN